MVELPFIVACSVTYSQFSSSTTGLLHFSFLGCLPLTAIPTSEFKRTLVRDEMDFDLIRNNRYGSFQPDMSQRVFRNKSEKLNRTMVMQLLKRLNQTKPASVQNRMGIREGQRCVVLE